MWVSYDHTHGANKWGCQIMREEYMGHGCRLAVGWLRNVSSTCADRVQAMRSHGWRHGGMLPCMIALRSSSNTAHRSHRRGLLWQEVDCTDGVGGALGGVW